jgi:beta-lactamase regulating signal transducer with metallopeptidase domain
MITTFLKFIASAALLFAFYRIVLRGKASYTVSRVYLLLLPIISVLFSVVTFEVYPSGTEIAIESYEPVAVTFNSEPAAVVSTTPESASVAVSSPSTAQPTAVSEPAKVGRTIVIDWYSTLQWAIPAVSLLLLLLAVYHICKVLVIKSKMQVENTAEGYSLIHSPKVDTPFSFAKTIFLPTSLNEPGKSLIIRHEKAHIRHRHYADVWFMELITRLLWFNPFVWLCRNELRNVHEFQADHDVISSDVNINAYQTTLLEMVMNVSSPVVNGFNHSFIRRRFVEMKNSTEGTLGRVAKIGTLVWFVAMFCAFTFTEKKPEPTQIAEETAVQAADSVKTLGLGKFVIEGAVDPGITDSCYLIYFADENFEIIEKPVACVPVVDKKFHYEVELDDLTVCRIRCIFPGGEICSAWIETLAAPDITFELTVHNGYYSSSSLYSGYLTKIRRLADTYCKNHHLDENVAKPDGLYKTWENVKYGNWNNHKIDKVDFCEKKTVVTLSTTHWERADLSSDVCLRDTAGNLYKMLHNESTGNRYIDYICGARYAFEPLPKGVTQFDIVQKVHKKVSFFNQNGENEWVDIADYNVNVIVADITENLNADQKPNFSITFKTELTKEISGFRLELMSADETQPSRVIDDVYLGNNGEATFSTYLDEPCIVWVLQTLADGGTIGSYQISIPFVPGENAQFTLKSTGIKRDGGLGFKMEMPSYQLTGSKFYAEWEKAEKKFNEMFDKQGDKANAAINEYVKKNANNLGLVMQYLIGPWNADYSILPQKTLQNPMVKILKQRNDAWAKEREEALKRLEKARANAAPGKMFIDLDLMNMTNTNNRPSLSDIVGKGRHVLVHFSYSDDGAIKDSVEALWKKQKGGEVDVIGIKCTHISMSNFYDKIYKDMGISYKMYYDTSHKSSQYGLGGKDEVILFGPNGTILKRDIAADDIEKVVEEILN